MQNLKRLGEVGRSFFGQEMTIIEYNNSTDLSVKFEDGTIVKHKTYTAFKRGQIGNPNYYQIYVGQENTSVLGQKMKIIKYRNNKDIDIEFEDGTIVEHKSIGCFKTGEVKNPNFYKNKYIGMTKYNTQGFKMTIIKYRLINDIDVQFEDGSISEHKQFSSFNKGTIKYPNEFKARIGEKAKALNGQEMEIIAYRGSDDLDIRFEDGTVITNKDYYAFQKGEIGNPNWIINSRVGQKNISVIGEPMKVIAYRSRDDIDIEFEGGIIAKHKSYSHFKTGKIGHPYIKNSVRGAILTINNITGKKVFDRYYHCQCSKCKMDTVMTFIEAKNHKC